MRGRSAGGRRGRRGRRTSQMIRTAHERIGDLFGLAESESRRGPGPLPTRYVRLARRIGMRYNVRVLPEYRHLYCRRCSTYWVEGRTVRTRLRSGGRVQTCLECGAVRRVRVRPRPPPTPPAEGVARPYATPEEPVLVDDSDDSVELDEGEEE